MRRQRRRCWKDFLAEPTNIWKAAKYLTDSGSSGLARIARLKHQDGYAESCEEISETLQRIYDAWREGKVLSLLSFDVKGAYNGVSRDVLLRRLRQRRIPEVLVKWVETFCSNRSASVVVNGETSRVIDLPQAGLPQGSPLSPMLFLFFNADLVYAWVTGSSASENVAKLQRTVVARAEEWEATSGATFETGKTTLIYFTRNEQRRSDEPIVVKGREVHPKAEAKILGVVFDQELRFKAYAGRIAKRGIQAALALKRL
ncbi:hypothetical protein GTA08_BOTSDO13081 [Botryosphaeria dothidea]|uniref:Reverse transcriptase domain-containing protein n=1 Tax=Botryosphaeria dothidea TaxID=55169 RepID=A0A8H4J1J7_9PEZI|nr:hypothetical protein GTA08_BOTSDO13081 [Botryosphaeria dothidea]